MVTDSGNLMLKTTQQGVNVFNEQAVMVCNT
jgi:hypothetical protein